MYMFVPNILEFFRHINRRLNGYFIFTKFCIPFSFYCNISLLALTDWSITVFTSIKVATGSVIAQECFFCL